MPILGLLQLDIFIPESRSLKDKRKVIKSIRETVRKKFNVSIAETGDHEIWGKSQLSISKVSNQSDVIRKEFQNIQKDIERRYPLEIVNKVEEVW
ncbi:MAG: DUF503 domain-containing protein [Candidatus Marinimicrobia bacterium]|nr:DUF503 domain-containing protein [Candidatus Neomarinimicrobiota bacterium]MCH8305540.1 DUF503 domain-containing protein [Candidatus Neomarinimicrobiota bacterium]